MTMDNEIIIFVMVCFVLVMVWVELVAKSQDRKINKLQKQIDRLKGKNKR